MTGTAHHMARSLIVVSRDHGELSLAMSFLRGQEFASQATVLLPDNLYPAHRGSLPVPALPYATAGDVLGAADELQPDLVFLFSGYLLPIDRLLSADSLDTLLGRLRERGCRILTSDPFLGLLPRLTLAQVDTRMLAPGHPAWSRWLTRLVVRLRGKVIDVPGLDDVTHLYPTSIPGLADGVPRLAFFNPASVRGAPESTARPTGQDPGGPAGPRPPWLFALSASDLHCQQVLLGQREFTELLLGMLRYAVEVERHPTLIAPPELVDRLAGVLPEVELLPGCPFAEFERRLLSAEYLFSWNAFSSSHLPRLVNELPVFLFDRGYYSKTIEPFYATARQCHFSGWEPTYLDQRQLFSPYVLAHLAKTQKPALRALRERWQSSPAPDAVVDQVLEARIRTGSS